MLIVPPKIFEEFKMGKKKDNDKNRALFKQSTQHLKEIASAELKKVE